jgi:ribosomal protein S18 acetylase RimI-like enzyme
MGTNTSPVLAVAPVAATEVERAVAVISLAFCADPMARWSYPDPHAYATHFPRLVRAFGGRAFQHGSAHQVSGFRGAALWLPPGVHPDHEALETIMRETLPADVAADAAGVFERMGGYHPNEPHWYLPLIGVDPAWQGRGHGAALLRHALRRCDEDHAAAYLESSNPANIPLYERHGFVQLGTIQVGSSPPVVPMLRDAR